MALVLPILASFVGVLPGSRINCWHYDVDLVSGRVRWVRYFAFVPVRTTVSDSALSQTLRPEDKNGLGYDWRRVRTSSPGHPDAMEHPFRSAFIQISDLQVIWARKGFEADARRASATTVLQLWQSDRGTVAAAKYLDSFWQTP